MVGRRQHACQLANSGREQADFQLPLGQPAAMAADRPIDRQGRRGQPATGSPGLAAKAAIQNAGVVAVARPSPGTRLPSQPAKQVTRPVASRGLAAPAGQRMPLGEAAKQGEPEQIALPLVDPDGEMVVPGVAQGVPHQEGPAAVDAQGVDRGIPHAAAGHHLRDDRLPLPAGGRVDGRGSPAAHRITGNDPGGDSSQPPLHQLSRGDRPPPGLTAGGKLGGVRQQQPQRARRLGRQRGPAAVESVPDDSERVTPRPRPQQVVLADLEAVELEGRVVGVLERVEGVGPQPEAVGVGRRQSHQHDHRRSLVDREQLDQPAVGRPGDKHFCA